MNGSPCQLSRGDLADSPLAAVLVEALRARATGVLELEARGGTSRIFFRAGHPVASQVFFEFKSLGQFLLELGWIDIVGLERSLAGVAAGRKQGEVLVELGLLSPERLHLGLGLQQQAQLRTLAALEEGTYCFQPGPDLPPWTRDLRMSAHRAIIDALTAVPGQRLVARLLAAVPPGHGLVLRDGWERMAAQFELDAWEERFVGRLVRPQALDRAMASAPVPAEKARALCACFLLMGLVRPVAPAAVAPPPPSPPAPAPDDSVGFGRNVVTAPPPTVPLESMTPGPAGWGLPGLTPGPAMPPPPRTPTPGPAVAPFTPGPGAGGERPGAPAPVPFDPFADGFAAEPPPPPPDPTTERLRKLREAQEKELAEFERSRAAAEAETRRLRAEQDEADRKAREAALSRPPPEFKSDAAAARARRARMLRRAFGSIAGAPGPLPPAPGEFEPERTPSRTPPPERTPPRTPPPERTPPRTPAPERTPSAVPPPEPSGPATPGPAVAPPAGVEDAEARAARIRERHRRIAGEDYFRRLGLPRSANREAVKRAFFEAAKQYHPDRVPKELAHLVPELKDIFSAVNEAYEVLQDEERRRTYEASLNAGDARPPVDQQLRGLVQVAQTAMRHRAFADAERAYRQAASLQERPDLLAHAAWAVLSDPARRDDAPRMRTELASIAASHPRSPEAHYYLGVIARSEHDEEAAERHFRAALHANPKHAEAAQELRRLQKRRPGPGRR